MPKRPQEDEDSSFRWNDATVGPAHRTAIDTPRKPAHFGALGPMAEWLRRGLQILARRFDSGSGLHS